MARSSDPVIAEAAQRLSGIHGSVRALRRAWVPARASLGRDNRKRRLGGFPAAVVVMLFAGLAGAEEVRVGDIVVTQAWGRASVGTAPGALYLTIRNAGEAADRLVGVATPAARMAELHVTTTEGGVVTMGHAETLDLPAGQTVTLAPGGTHIMLMGLAAPLKQGQTVQLTLQFEGAGSVEVSAPIGSIGAKGP
jgi:copper(I)-binding protein